jgi:hypothetical protein
MIIFKSHYWPSILQSSVLCLRAWPKESIVEGLGRLNTRFSHFSEQQGSVTPMEGRTF